MSTAAQRLIVKPDSVHRVHRVHRVPPVPEGYAPVTGGPFMRMCGAFYLHEAKPVMAMPITADHLNSLGIVHGGMLATIIDTAMGVVIGREIGAVSTPTISLSIDYLGAVREGDFVEGHVDVHKLGARICNASCLLKVGQRLVARASGVFIMGGRAARVTGRPGPAGYREGDRE